MVKRIWRFFRCTAVVTAAAACALGLSSCGLALPFTGEQQTRFSEVFVGPMDTVTQLTAYCSSQERFDTHVAQVRALLERLDRIFDCYGFDGTVRGVNERAGKGPVTVEPELIEAIEKCRTLSSKTPGMNIALGSVLSLWEQARREGTPPQEEALRQALVHTSMTGVITTATTVELTDAQTSLDLSGYAKGYAADRIAARLKADGLTCFLLNVGESSLVCAGAPPGKTGWTVGLRNPDKVLNLSGTENPSELSGTMTLSDRCVGVSGDYQKYFEADGTYYSHIIDETSGWPARYYRAVCVTADSAAEAEFYTKALFTAAAGDALQMAGETPGLEALWVLPNGGMLCTSGFALTPSES
ncbi:MAG: FAD:protein FMN transferase [Clostridiales bacterium]|nr:FAD:protein FMN transferase [Clostridiales bacterium]